MEPKQESRVFLQEIANRSRSYEDLPPPWSSFRDLRRFSDKTSLYDHQVEALKNAIKILYLYYQEARDYREGEPFPDANNERKEKLLNEYKTLGLDQQALTEKKDSKVYRILSEFYPQEEDGISFRHKVNRMAFWMASSSGKTYVIVKLVEVLHTLMMQKEIPNHDILIMTVRDDLVNKLQQYIDEYNKYNSPSAPKIRINSLKDFEKVKTGRILPGGDNTIDIFIYRSDLISDEEKPKIIDFRNYENDGKWYVILDEAHKGGKGEERDESKRQAFYSIMSRNGFLFNFSATFVEPIDIYTTVYNFNLAQFIANGFGKNIYVSKQETKAFKESNAGEQKQKIVLKTMILLAYLKKTWARLRKESGKNIYHDGSPMMLTLVHSVNPNDSKVQVEPDLVLFFKELEKVARNELKEGIFEVAKEELVKEFEGKKEYVFGTDILFVDTSTLEEITYDDVLQEVFNSGSPAQIEAIVSPSNKKELVFKLKSSPRPFALIRIGDTSAWRKEILSGYEINENWEDKSFFDTINENDDINLLMGSRAFYEGWDSNRPNIICFINIGKEKEARLFVLQAIGRGGRIEPLQGRIKRMSYLRTSGDKEAKEVCKILNDERFSPIETLFIFGTSKDVISDILTIIDTEKLRAGETLSLDISPKAREHQEELLVPYYAYARKVELKKIPKFTVDQKSLDYVRKYVDWINDDRVLLMLHFSKPGLGLEDLRRFKQFIEKEENFNLDGSGAVPHNILIEQLVNHVSVSMEELEKFKRLEDEIVHFKKIGVLLGNSLTEDKLEELKTKIKGVKDYPLKQEELKKINSLYGKISAEDYNARLNELQTKYKEKDEFPDEGNEKIDIQYIADHYYVPVIISQQERVWWITHIINVKSERDFIKSIINYVEQKGNSFNKFDWWVFSKIDENLDEVYIPYYDSRTNSPRKFKPDFIFWLKKQNNYAIVFIDPKGTSYTDYQYKVGGYSRLFEENGKKKVFKHNGLSIRVYLYFYTDDVQKLSDNKYRGYWIDNTTLGQVLSEIANDMSA